jgi:hypothetical protein
MSYRNPFAYLFAGPPREDSAEQPQPDETDYSIPAHWNFTPTEGNYELLPNGTDLRPTDEVYRESTYIRGYGASGHWEPVGHLKHYSVVGGVGHYIVRRPLAKH